MVVAMNLAQERARGERGWKDLQQFNVVVMIHVTWQRPISKVKHGAERRSERIRQRLHPQRSSLVQHGAGGVKGVIEVRRGLSI